ILVGIGSKARERHEAGRRPFPHIPDHLPASEGAVARGARGDVERAVEGKTEIGAFGARRRLAPRPAALEVGQASRTLLDHGGSPARRARPGRRLTLRRGGAAGARRSCSMLAPRTSKGGLRGGGGGALRFCRGSAPSSCPPFY